MLGLKTHGRDWKKISRMVRGLAVCYAKQEMH